MPDRIIKVYGHTSGATATFTFNGIEVFNGNIASTGSSSELKEMFTFNISTDVDGYVPGVLNVTTGTVCMSVLSANYSSPIHPEVTDDNGNIIVAMTADDLPTTFNFMSNASNLSSINCVIDDEAQPIPHDTSLPGSFHYNIAEGSVFTADWAIDPAILS